MIPTDTASLPHMSSPFLSEAIASELSVTLLEGVGCGIIGLDRDFGIILWNEWIGKHSSTQADSILGKNIFDSFPSIKEKNQERYLQQCMFERIPVLLSPFFHDFLIPLKIIKGDRTLSMKQSVKIFPVSGTKSDLSVVIVIQDLTEQIIHEEIINRLTRVLKGIRSINKLITRVTSKDELFEGACKILIEKIGYDFSWIGLIEGEGFEQKPVAVSGIKMEDLDELVLLSDHSDYGRGAAIEAIKTGKPQVKIIERNEADSLSSTWQGITGPIRHRSSCSLPLKKDKRVIGTVNVYSNEENVFYEEELDLLQEVAQDIEFAIATLEEREQRQYFQMALAGEKERLSVTLRSIGDGVITTDIDGRVISVNTVAETLTGWTQAEAEGTPLTEVFNIVNEHTRESCENPVEKVLKSGKIIGLANHTVLIAKDGTEKPIGDSGAPIWGKENTPIGVVMVFRDMSEQLKNKIEKEKLLEDLAQSQKMESIGTLTAGISHDFNNILGIIVGNTELALDEIPQWNPAHSYLEDIKTASLRATMIVKQLLSFTRNTGNKLQSMEICAVLKDALKFLRSTIPTTIKIQLDIRVTDETVLADPIQINQIIMNLCINASQAMTQTGGTLSVKIEKVVLEENEAKDSYNLKNGHHIKISVNDTGPGIDPAIIDRIFDPYFTTKEVGKGSGMGLAVVQGIVKNHNGSISVNSSAGHGTTFTILFPMTDQEKMIEKDTSEKTLMGTESVLLVDDEIPIVKMVKRMLERLGYKVNGVNSSQDALTLFRENPSHFDLVITDMTMPHMTGVMLSEKIMEIRPDIPIIICTGHSAIVDEEKAQKLGLSAFVMKPIDHLEISTVIRKVLDETVQ